MRSHCGRSLRRSNQATQVTRSRTLLADDLLVIPGENRTLSALDIDNLVKNRTLTTEDIDNLVKSRTLSAEDIDNLVKSRTLSAEDIDHLVKNRTLLADVIDNPVKSRTLLADSIVYNSGQRRTSQETPGKKSL